MTTLSYALAITLVTAFIAGIYGLLMAFVKYSWFRIAAVILCVVLFYLPIVRSVAQTIQTYLRQ